MMGVYIRGFNLPEKSDMYYVKVECEAGKNPVATIWRRDLMGEMSFGAFEVVPVQPHGGLGDLDKLVEKIDGIWDCNDMVFSPNDHCCNVPEDCKGCKWAETKNFIRRMVANAQTIIPEEEDK